jgi:hypothetical protein
MVITYERVKTAAVRLTARQRNRLAHQLSRFVTPTRREIEEEWAKEIEGRVAEIDAGTAILHDSDEVIAELRRGLERARQDKLDIENAQLDEVERRIRLQDAGLIDDIDADDLFRDCAKRACAKLPS